MASELEIKRDIIAPMVNTYGKPRQITDEAAYLRAYLEDLAGYSTEQLQAGWRELRRTHLRTTWPTIAELCAAIKSANVFQDAPSQQDQTKQDEWQKWYDIAGKSPYYQEAVEMGVPLFFRYIAITKKREPRKGDVAEARVRLDNHARRVIADEQSDNIRVRNLARLGRDMIDQNNAMCEAA